MAIINFLLLKKNKNLPSKSVQVEAFVEHMKLITDSDAFTPVAKPQITIFTKSGRDDLHNSAFGGHRGRPHNGLDIFTPYRTELKACMDGKGVYTGSMTGYGKTIVIKVDKNKLESYRKDYTLQYDKEVREGDSYMSGENRYLLYAHLDSFSVKLNQKVKKDDVVALSGVTGYAEGTHGPHLHFEISSKKLPSKGDGYKYRSNPLNYITLTKEDKAHQKKFRKQTYTKE